MKIGDRVEVTTLPRVRNKFIKVGDTGRIITYRLFNISLNCSSNIYITS